MTVTLPEEMREELERKAKAAGFLSVEMYLAELVHADEGPLPLPQPSPGACYSVSSREELEEKLLEGMDTTRDTLPGLDFTEKRLEAAQTRNTKDESQ